MYDDEVQVPISLTASDRYYKCAKFPTRNIRTPTILIYGGSDSLVDIDVMLRELPPHTIAKEIPPYEHLDFLWASNVDSLVFPTIFDSLRCYAQSKEFVPDQSFPQKGTMSQKGKHFQTTAKKDPGRPHKYQTEDSTPFFKDESRSPSMSGSFGPHKDKETSPHGNGTLNSDTDKGPSISGPFLTIAQKHIDVDEAYRAPEESRALQR